MLKIRQRFEQDIIQFLTLNQKNTPHYHLQVQAKPKKIAQKKTLLFLASMGETGLCHDIFFLNSHLGLLRSLRINVEF